MKKFKNYLKQYDQLLHILFDHINKLFYTGDYNFFVKHIRTVSILCFLHSMKISMIYECLLDKNHQQLFDSIDHRLFRQLISFLKLFVNVTKLLSNEQQSTLHLVLPCCEKLIQVAKESSNDEHPDLIKFKKKNFLQHIQSDWPVQDEHYIAAVLHRQFKQLEIFSKKSTTTCT